METTTKRTVEYKFLRQNVQHQSLAKKRLTVVVYLSLFHLAFIVLYGFFIGYKYEDTDTLHKKLTSNIIFQFHYYIHTILNFLNFKL